MSKRLVVILAGAWLLAPATAPAQPCTGTADVTLGLLMPDDVVTCQGGKVSFCITRPAFPAPAPYDQVHIDPAGLDSFDPDDPATITHQNEIAFFYRTAAVRALQINTPVATVIAGFKRGQYNPTGVPAPGAIRAHRGVAAANLQGVRRPSDMIGEDFVDLDDRTYRVEFKLPQSDFERQILHDPVADIPIYAWYIKGDGFTGSGSNPRRTLIVVTSGFDMHMDLGRGGSAGDPPFFLGPAQVGLRRLIRELVLTGFDVLLWDKRNIGFSGGRARESYGTDIFALLDQLEDGVLSLGSNDTTPVWRSGTTLLPDTAKQTPVILWGYSHGGTISMRAMAQNFSGKPIDVRFNPDGTLRLEESSPRGYNFIGIVVQGQVLPPLRFTVSGTGIAAMNKAELRHSGYSTTGDVWNTIPQWPASLFFTGTREEFTIAGSVAMYNQARGFKKLVTIQGDHGDYLLGGFVDHVIEETVDFARQVAAQQSSQRAPHDAGSTTVERAVCGSQPRAVN